MSNSSVSSFCYVPHGGKLYQPWRQITILNPAQKPLTIVSGSCRNSHQQTQHIYLKLGKQLEMWVSSDSWNKAMCYNMCWLYLVSVSLCVLLSFMWYLYLSSTVVPHYLAAFAIPQNDCCLPDHWHYDLDTVHVTTIIIKCHIQGHNKSCCTPLCWVVCVCLCAADQCQCNEVAGAEVVQGKGCEITCCATTTFKTMGSLYACTCGKRQRWREKERKEKLH